MKRPLLVSSVIGAVLVLASFSRIAAEPWTGVSADSLASPAGPGSAEPNLAVGPDGRVYLSWHEPADSGFALRMSVLDGRVWSEPRTIRTGRDFFVNWADF